ncbi:alpha-L-rhamnosidase-related protein [Labilibacter marinus]|uniref:alpha-L-rhamnosidase-related protein n=1 Tax=Labilibacter marinus TaxID=1477105 RepID=UPI00094F6D09|nr:family 78 glycoside hydrolase catalytic domain [Labilibacter marinus]
MKQAIAFLALLVALIGCKNESQMLYQNKDFSVYTNKVVQGEYTAQVLPDGSMTSNYLSSANEARKRTIELKFSINQKDNELPFATNHQIVVKPENGNYTTPIITFGKQFKDENAGLNEALEINTPLTVQLDMRHVFKAFEEDGFYEDLNGDKIYKADFKGVFVAGNVTPLSFDFENLPGDVMLEDKDGDHIYKLTLNINTHDPDRFIKPSWKLSEDISAYPNLKTDNALLQALYNMALEETALLSEADGTFRTGAKWAGVWTRDVSYAIDLGMGIADVERARVSLLKKVKRNRIIQDTGSGGAWPVSSDRTTWAIAAWEVYLITGDKDWLEYCYKVIKNTIEDDRKVVYNSANGLYRGESSFLDWRVQTYPAWLDNVDIFNSMNLGTNMVHYKALDILSQMATIRQLNEEADKYKLWAKELKRSINQHFWLNDKGYYAQFIYGRNAEYISDKSESLGEAFSVLFNVADEKSLSVIENTPIATWGTPCVYPQIPDIRAYHNNGIWPFVQAYWNMASAKAENETALEHGLSSLYRASALFLTNKENMVADNGDFITALNSDRQLWSVAGNLGMVYKVLFGIKFTPENNMQFSPFIPESYQGKLQLSNLKIRNKQFEISISGFGNKITEFKVDGQLQNEHAVSLIGEGEHHIEITMSNQKNDGRINMVGNSFHLHTPEINIEGSTLTWKPVKDASSYDIYKDGELVNTTSNFSYNTDKKNGEYGVIAIDAAGKNSFISEPIYIGNEIKTNLKQFVKDKTISTASFPDNAIEISKTKNKTIDWTVKVPQEGMYSILFEYTNGNGPWNTDNKCAIRTLWVNDNKKAPIVMPQRGINEWASIGETNVIKTELKKGNNSFKISFEAENENMNIVENKALLTNMILKKLNK